MSMKGLPRSTGAAATGFSLTELMVTLVIAAILACIAIPSYTQQVRKARRVEARNTVLDFAVREERFFSTNSAYSASPSSLGASGVFPQIIGSGYYQVSVCVAAALPCGNGTATTGNVFTITATPVGIQASDTQCASFSLDSTGLQSATGTNPAGCWGN
jgi:type IV pilus assembly protein PilE